MFCFDMLTDYGVSPLAKYCAKSFHGGFIRNRRKEKISDGTFQSPEKGESYLKCVIISVQDV